MPQHLQNRSRATAVLVVLALWGAGCHVAVGELAGQATSEWVRTYELAPGGEIQISSTNGGIEIEGYDGATVEVRAERSARAVNDEAAREIVERITIQEEITPERVAVRTEGISGVLVGVSYQVKYRVRAPHSVVARLRTTNGLVTARGFGGRLIATSTNGGVVGENLAGRVEARATNGPVQIAMRAMPQEGVSIRTTNGRVDLALPADAKADVSAECRNGEVRIDGLPIDIDASGEQTRRSVQGRLNGGGPRVDVNTTNGAIRLRALGTEL